MNLVICWSGLARQSALLKEEGCEIDIDFYIMSVLALLKLIQVTYSTYLLKLPQNICEPVYIV